MKKRKLLIPLPIIVAIAVVVLGGVGFVGALNGWFGGGGSIPEDSFTRGLVGYWSFDEGYGTTTYDGSGSGNDGMTNGGMATTSWATGKLGGALKFDGVDDYVNAGSGTSLNIPTGGLTLEVWVKLAGSLGDHRTIIAKGNAGDNGGYGLQKIDSNIVRFYHSGGAVGYKLDTTDTLTLNTWYHLIATMDENNFAKIYINGVEKAGGTLNARPSNTQNLAIGARDQGTLQFFNGLIDEVRIYNRALSDAEVRYHYNRGGPVGYWKFDEGSGSVAYDSTSNNNDGTIPSSTQMATSTSGSSGWVQGKYGSALSFDGVDDYVNVSDNNLGLTDKFTFEAWVKIPSSETSGHVVVIDSAGNIRTRFLQSGNTMTLSITTASQVNSISTTQTNDNKWHYITGTYDGTTQKIYIDGIQEDSDAQSGSIGSGGTNIGAASNGGFLLGLIDDVRIYNYARTPEEIRLDYNAGFGAKFGYSLGSCQQDPASCMSNGLAGYWNFDERNGTSTADGSDNGNIGMLVGGMATTSWTTGVKPLSGGVSGGGALSFDGTDDYVDIGNPITSISTDITISLWMYYKTDSTYRFVLSLDNDSGIYNEVNPHIIISKNTTDKITFRAGGGGYELSSGNGIQYTPSSSGWYYVVGVKNGAAYKLYVNGAEQGSATQSGISGSLVKGRIGSGKNIYSYNDKIDEVRVYNRALSAEEIRYHYNKGGPVAQWKMDEGSGSTAYDATNNNNDGTIFGAAWASGKYGTALSFDGTDDYVLVPDKNNLDITDAITLEAWIKTNQAAGVEQQMILDKRTGASQYNYRFFLDSSNYLNFSFYNGAHIGPVAQAPALQPNTWYHVSAAYDKSRVILYVNGLLVNSAAENRAMVADSSNLSIGRQNYTVTRYFNGLIDDVRIYNYARTPEQIKLDYNAGLAAKLGPSGKDCNTYPASCVNEGLVGYWNFDERNGTSTADLSGNGNNGMMRSGMATTSWTTGIKPFTDGTKGGGALAFDGVDDYVSGAIPQLTSNAFTVSFWLYWQNNPATYEHPLTLGDYDISFYVDSTGYFAITGDQSTVISGALSTNKWYFVTDTFDGTAYKIYLNGRGGQPAAGSLSLGNNNFYIGSTNTPHNFFKGIIDEVRIYNRALSAEEIRYHYNKGGPVAQWKMDEGEGRIVYDSTNNNNDGTLVLAGSATSSAWVQGKYGGALSFDGVDDYASISYSSSLGIGTGNFTVECWMKSPSNAGWDNLVSSRSAGFDVWFWLEAHPTIPNKLRVGITSKIANAPFDPYNDKWHHIVAVRDGGNLFLVMDGKKGDVTTGATGSITTSATWYIGKRQDAGYEYNGLIDDVRIYNYARTEEQIGQDYNAGLSTHFK